MGRRGGEEEKLRGGEVERRGGDVGRRGGREVEKRRREGEEWRGEGLIGDRVTLGQCLLQINTVNIT